jgi:hypothetical protein
MERLQQEIASIANEDLRKMVTKALELAPKEFFTIAASSSGNYHPAQSNGEGGLIQHTKMICSMVPIFCRAYSMKQWEQDEIMVAAIMHDFHKPSYFHAINTWQWMHYANIKTLLQDECSITEETYDNIADMVKYHMGQWTNKPHTKPISTYTTQEWVLHLADMVVTNKQITFDFKREE